MGRVKKITKVFYACPVCGTVYETKLEAEECSRRTMEKQIFKVGDMVSNVESRFCEPFDEKTSYTFSGKITEVHGPEPSDEDYEIRHLGGYRARINAHVFYYVVEYRCPKCKRKKKAVYFTPELIAVKK